MNPEILQTLGILAIGLGFVLIGLGGFSTYQASQQIQHAAQLREVEQKGELNAQIMTLLVKNQDLQSREASAAAPNVPSAVVPVPPEPTTPPPVYYRPPSPPPPPAFSSSPPPVGEAGRAETAVPPVRSTPPATGPETEAPAPSPVEPRRESGASDWEEPETLEPETPMRFLSIRQQHVIAGTLRAHGLHVVTVESSYGDPVSREFAGELGKAFEEAGWVVRGISEHRGLPLASGVTVSAGSFPPQPETRAMYEALLSAGIAVTQQLNPKQHEGETVVLVGTPL